MGSIAEHKGKMDRDTETSCVFPVAKVELTEMIEGCRSVDIMSRLVAAFLGCRSCPSWEQEMGRLRSGLLWSCLPAYAEKEGWKELGRIGFTMNHRPDVSAPEMGVLELSESEWVEVPRNVMVLERGEERALIQVFRPEGFDSVPITIIAVRGAEEFIRGWKRFAAAGNPLKGRVLLPTGKLLEWDREYSWDDLFLDERKKDAIRFEIGRFARHDSEKLKELGIRRRGGFILTGPPGSGKTLIGRILVQSVDRTFIWVTPGHLRSPGRVEEVFQLSRMLAPSVLFLEDLDILAEDREMAVGSVVLGELMNQMDGGEGDHPILTIATTNRLQVMEKALRSRPGRFDRVIEIGLPDASSAARLLESRLAGHQVLGKDLDWFTRKAAGRTGAELEELANTALLLAMDGDEKTEPGKITLSRVVLEEALGLLPIGERDPEVGF